MDPGIAHFAGTARVQKEPIAVVIHAGGCATGTLYVQKTDVRLAVIRVHAHAIGTVADIDDTKPVRRISRRSLPFYTIDRDVAPAVGIDRVGGTVAHVKGHGSAAHRDYNRTPSCARGPNR